MGKENPLAIDMLNTALYVPEQAAISYKKVKSVYNDTKVEILHRYYQICFLQEVLIEQ